MEQDNAKVMERLDALERTVRELLADRNDRVEQQRANEEAEQAAFG